MSAPYPYRVQGTGPRRKIYEGATLIGTIFSSPDGWGAWRPDGTLVRDADGNDVLSPTIARWRTPRLWRTP